MEASGDTCEIAQEHLETPTRQDKAVPCSPGQSIGPITSSPQADQGDRQGSDRNELTVSAGWPEEPEPVDPGEGTRDDRLRMLRHMRQVWSALTPSP